MRAPKKLGMKSSSLGRYTPSVTRKKDGSVTEVYMRPQESSGVQFQLERNLRNYETHDDARVRVYENPAISAERFFNAGLADNLSIVSKLVTTYNHKHRSETRRKSEIATLVRAYQNQMEQFNICWRCEMPIKVKQASIEFIDPQNPKPLKRESEDIVGKVALPPSPREAEKLGWDSLDVQQVIKSRKRPNSTMGQHWHTARDVKNVLYADVLAHYKFVLSSDKVASYVLVDSPRDMNGKRRTIRVVTEFKTITRMKRGKRVTKKIPMKYFVEVLPDGSHKRVIPNRHYRVLNQKCECDFRKRV